MTYIRVAALAELAEGGALAVEAEGRRLCLVRCDGEVYAFQDNCTHRDFPLSEGEVDCEEGSITCEWHGARFDVRTGRALCLPATRPVPVYDCRIDGDGILVDLGGA